MNCYTQLDDILHEHVLTDLHTYFLTVFRLNKPLEPERAKFPKIGSKFRYPGRTQHQLAGAEDTGRPAPVVHRAPFSRLQSHGPTDTLDTQGNSL